MDRVENQVKSLGLGPGCRHQTYGGGKYYCKGVIDCPNIDFSQPSKLGDVFFDVIEFLGKNANNIVYFCRNEVIDD